MFIEFFTVVAFTSILLAFLFWCGCTAHVSFALPATQRTIYSYLFSTIFLSCCVSLSLSQLELLYPFPFCSPSLSRNCVSHCSSSVVSTPTHEPEPPAPICTPCSTSDRHTARSFSNSHFHRLLRNFRPLSLIISTFRYDFAPYRREA